MITEDVLGSDEYWDFCENMCGVSHGDGERMVRRFTRLWEIGDRDDMSGTAAACVQAGFSWADVAVAVCNVDSYSLYAREMFLLGQGRRLTLGEALELWEIVGELDDRYSGQGWGGQPGRPRPSHIRIGPVPGRHRAE